MELQTISQVSKRFHISTRTLRYYEQIGLLASTDKEDYAYRTYDAMALRRLQQILVLRKLRISLKQISEILSSEEAVTALDVFRSSLSEIDEEITALSTIRAILSTLIQRLNENTAAQVKLNLLGDEVILKILDTLSITKISLKEEKSMEDLNHADEMLSKLKNVRIVYLPPATVAASHYIGSEPENHAGEALDRFIRENNLTGKKPDLRVYGFNNPNPSGANAEYGYEFWVTIPEDMEVLPPLEKKHFGGGLYAAHCIKMGDFHEWMPFYNWLKSSPEYEIDPREPLSMGGCMEEHINAYSYYCKTKEDAKFIQLDLLTPVKAK